LDHTDGVISCDDTVSRFAGTYQRLYEPFMEQRAEITVGQDAGC